MEKPPKSNREQEIEAELRAIEERDAQMREELRQAMEALDRETGRESLDSGSPDTKRSTPPLSPEPTPPNPAISPKPSADTTPKKGETAPQPPAIKEVESFINEFNLRSILPEEFSALNSAQQLKVIRDLKRRIVDVVKSNAQTQYSEDLKERMRKNSDPAISANTRKFATLARNIKTSIKSSITKEKDLKVAENNAFKNLIGTAEGKKLIAEDLNRLIQTTSGREVILSSQGNPFVVYLKANSPETREAVLNFNQKAFEFTKIPYEWGQEKKGKNRKKYEKAKAEYEKARYEILIAKGKEEGIERTLAQMLEIDNALQMEQLLNTHPEFEKKLAEFGETPDGKEMVKTAGNFLQTITGGKNLTNKLLTAGGFGLRMAAKGAVALSGATMITGIAAPIIGGTIGGLRGAVRAGQTLEERKKGARRGKEDESKEANKTVKAEDMALYINKILYDLGNPNNSRERNEALIKRLKIRVDVTRGKIEQGLMDFGDAKSSLGNQFILTSRLNEALITLTSQDEAIKTETDKRVEKLLSFRSEQISEAQSTFIKKQAMRGALMGAGFATAGYGLRWLWEHFHVNVEEHHAPAGGAKNDTENARKLAEQLKSNNALKQRLEEEARVNEELKKRLEEEAKAAEKLRQELEEVKTETEPPTSPETPVSPQATVVRPFESETTTRPIMPTKPRVATPRIEPAPAPARESTPLDMPRTIRREPTFSTNPQGIKADTIKDGYVVTSEGPGGKNIVFNTNPRGISGETLRPTKPEIINNPSSHPTTETPAEKIPDQTPKIEHQDTPVEPEDNAPDHEEPELNSENVDKEAEITEAGESEPAAEPMTENTQGIAPENVSEDVPTTKSQADTVEELRTKIIEMQKLHDNPPTIPSTIETSRGSGGSNYVFNTNPQGIHMGNELHNYGASRHGEYFPGVDDKSNAILRSHPEFVQNNHLHLSGRQLIQAYEIHQTNVSHLFRGSYEHEWENLKSFKATTLFEAKNGDPEDPMMRYLNKLQEVTKLKPRGTGFFKRAETVNEYVARALQNAAKKGLLERLKF